MSKFSLTLNGCESGKIKKFLISSEFDEKLLIDENLKFLTEGSFSEIYSISEKYVIKTIKNNYCNHLDNISELTILNRLKSKYIMRTFGFFTINSKLCIILDRINMTLDDYKFETEECKICVIKQLYEGLSFLHSNMILHLDFVPSNIFIKEENSIPIVTIGDFSLSCKTTDLTVESESHRITNFYRPYENLKGSLIYSDKSDIWSLGIIIYEIMNDIKISNQLMKITVDLEYNYDMSIILFIEKNLCWGMWPLKGKEIDLNPFLCLDFKSRYIPGYHCDSLSKTIYTKKIYTTDTNSLYVKLLNSSLCKLFKSENEMYVFCYNIVYCFYNYPDKILFNVDKKNIGILFDFLSEINFDLI